MGESTQEQEEDEGRSELGRGKEQCVGLMLQNVLVILWGNPPKITYNSHHLIFSQMACASP